MDERKFLRVQHHARRGEADQFPQFFILFRAVGFVAHERMADELEMDADLMRAPGVDLRLNPGGGFQLFENFIARMRRAAGIVVARGHALAVRWVPGDGGADFAGVARGSAADNRMVNLLHAPLGELFREREVRFVIFGDDEAATGFLVEPVDDAGPRHAADAAQRAAAVIQQGVDERMFLVSGGGMDDESGGLVQHEQRFILEQNVERHFFGLRGGGFRLRPVDFNLLARTRRVGGFDGLAVDADVAFFDEPLERATRSGGEFFTQKSVEPLVRQRFGDDEIFSPGIHPQIAQIFAEDILAFILNLRSSAKSAEKFFISVIERPLARARFSK